MTKDLLFMRHAKSDWSGPEVADHDRPLNARGRRVAPRMGDYLAHHQLVPDMVILSTARRAQETFELMVDRWPTRPETLSTRTLYLASATTFFEAVALAIPAARRVLVIGHNPGLSDLAGQFERSHPHLPTAGVLHLQTDLEDWLQIAQTPTACWLAGVFRPKEIGIDSPQDHD